jgi:CubicO group peptidase (beta-lactamase class C family)
MSKFSTTKAIFIFCSLFFAFTSANAQINETEINELLSQMYPDNESGATILIAKDGKAIYSKAFGSANLELNTPMNTNNVFEIGSITKQFTSVSILMLEEQGKLKVEDEITKYIPDYPTNGKTITIHHLLNHTSGIKSYTSMQSFMKLARTDMTPTELIDKFKNEPMDFNPGEKYLYNNSGYILLGHIIEVVSGQSYAEFIQDNIFTKLGMNASYYGSMTKLISNRASGYSQTDNGFSNANYLSLTLPYAAGSIMSTVDDLLIWQNAISANKLIKRSSLEKAINGSTLNSGEKIPYGYGWIKGGVNGSETYEHSGGIFGYSTNGIFLPKENMYVIGLSNCDCKNIGEVTTKAAAIAIGKPFPSIKDAITLSEDKLKKWTGAYEFEDGAVRFITLEGNKLKSQREGSTVFDIYAMSDDNFLFEGGTISYQFGMNKDGSKHVVMTSNGKESKGKAVNKEAPKEKAVISLDPEILKQFNGKYELATTFHIVVTTRDNQLFAQATGQPEFELFAESETTFFLKVVPASIDFSKNEKGEIISLTLHQGGRDMVGRKIE